MSDSWVLQCQTAGCCNVRQLGVFLFDKAIKLICTHPGHLRPKVRCTYGYRENCSIQAPLDAKAYHAIG